MKTLHIVIVLIILLVVFFINSKIEKTALKSSLSLDRIHVMQTFSKQEFECKTGF